MTKLGYTWYAKDWGNSKRVFRLTLAERGFYRELIDLAMFNGNKIIYEPDLWARLFNSTIEEIEGIIEKLLKYKDAKGISLIVKKGNYVSIPECEKRLENVNKNRINGAKGGRLKTQTKPKPNPDSNPNQTQIVTQTKPKPNPDSNPNQTQIVTQDERQREREREREIEIEKEKERIKEKKIFRPPNFFEVEQFFLEKTQNEHFSKKEAQKFVNFYASKGWMVGKNKMKQWKSAAANWLIHAKERQQNTIKDEKPKRTYKYSGTGFAQL